MEEEPDLAKISMSLLFSRALKSIPVDVSVFVNMSINQPELLFTEQTLDRLVQILLTEQDTHLSNKSTKLQVLEVLQNITTVSRDYRCALRIVLQDCKTWFDDEVDPEVRERTRADGHGELEPIKDKELVMKAKRVFAQCWRTPPALLKSLVQDDSITIEACKTIIIQHYAATAVQALVRSKLARSKLAQSLHTQSQQQEEENRQWSVIIIQRAARGYIARRTVLKSMLIRRSLNKEVLRIAESYLQHGDLWSFLSSINNEIKYYQKEIIENQEREENWAENFVERVIQKRQLEFNAAWSEFPQALSSFQKGRLDHTGSLVSSKKTTASSGSTGAAAAVRTVDKKSATVRTMSKSPAKLLRSTAASSAGRGSAATAITAEEVGLAMHSPSEVEPGSAAAGEASHLSVPGVMMRQALGRTVQVEVAERLNSLINGQYRSRKLAKDIRDVYGPVSDPTPKAICQSASKANKPSLAPVTTTRRRKKRAGLNGDIVQDVGRIEASHSDWLSNAVQTSCTASTTGTGAAVDGQPPGPGTSLLMDIPQGINDSIERLMHAAALRCYVPDFFQGVSSSGSSSGGGDATAVGLEGVYEHTVESMAETGMDESALETKLQLQRQKRQESNINANADYAYAMFLKLPVGLAKMSYELQCKRYAQGCINRLRLKGLSYLSDVAPVSKFVMCMKAVDTPRVLLNKCVDLYIELKNIGRSVPLGVVDKNSVQKFHRSVRTTTAPGGLHTLEEEQREAVDGQLAVHSAGRGLLRMGEMGFDSVLAADDSPLPATASDVKQPGDITGMENSITNTFTDTVSGRATQRKLEKHHQELPGKMLLSMVQDRDLGNWCDLKAPVEDIFLHAAFLVVPHVSYMQQEAAAYGSSGHAGSTSSGRDHVTGSTGNSRSGKIAAPKQLTRIESPMGNVAFKQHTAEVLRLKDEAEKRELIKERFRAAFILTTPYTLFLKSKRVYTVEDLLRVNLRDLAMPMALETQLEVLLTAVVAKCVDAKIVPIPRDHLATAAELYTVPMYYDPKFQRSPLDPFGRPPRLQQRHSHKLVQKKLRSQEKKESALNKAHNNLNKVASVAAIQEDLEEPVTLWTTNAHASGMQVKWGASLIEGEEEEGEDSGSDNDSAHRGSKMGAATGTQTGEGLVDGSVIDGKWSFHGVDTVSTADAPAGDGPVQTAGKGSTAANGEAPSLLRMNAERQRPSDASGAHIGKLQGLEIAPINDNNVWRKSLRSPGPAAGRSTAPGAGTKGRNTHLSSLKQFSQAADLMTRNIEDQVFKYSYVCTHPHCGQVFARQYTYNIHLKSHELFGQYHNYKRQPQLFLDKDRSQIAAAAQRQYDQRTTLPTLPHHT